MTTQTPTASATRTADALKSGIIACTLVLVIGLLPTAIGAGLVALAGLL